MSLSLIHTAWAAAAPITAPVNPIPRFTSIATVLAFVMNIVFYVGLTMTVIFLIIGGIRYIISGGDKAGVEGARGALTNAVIGFVVVVAAFAIRVITQNVLGGTAPTLPTVPGF